MPVTHLTAWNFRDRIFDYENQDAWKYKGNIPSIIDFYANWCGPCREIASLMEELSDEYAGKLEVYKIDIDKEQELSSLFGIQSIPTLLFIPMEGNLMVQKGALPKNLIKEVIEDRLLHTKLSPSDKD